MAPTYVDNHLWNVENSFMDWCERVGANGYCTPNTSTAPVSNSLSTSVSEISKGSSRSERWESIRTTATRGSRSRIGRTRKPKDGTRRFKRKGGLDGILHISPRNIMNDTFTELCSHLQTPFEGLAGEDLGIGRALEFWEPVEGFWSGSLRQPIEITIGARYVPVCACRNIDDNFPSWHDTSACQSQPRF